MEKLSSKLLIFTSKQLPCTFDRIEYRNNIGVKVLGRDTMYKQAGAHCVHTFTNQGISYCCAKIIEWLLSNCQKFPTIHRKWQNGCSYQVDLKRKWPGAMFDNFKSTFCVLKPFMHNTKLGSSMICHLTTQVSRSKFNRDNLNGYLLLQQRLEYSSARRSR